MARLRSFLFMSIGASICTLPAGLFGQRDFSDVVIKTTHVRGNIYMLEGQGGNIGVSIGPDGVLLIDDQFAPLEEKIRAAIDKIERPGKGKIKYVLNTHWHGDHTGGNAGFGRNATIIAHENVRKRLGSEQKVFGRVVPPSPKAALPVITFAEAIKVHFNDEDVRVLHLPKGHTDGDSVVFFEKSNVVHMGDHFFAGRFPFVDLGSGGDVEGLTENVRKILAKLPEDVKIIPGHGKLATLEDLRSYHRMLVETTSTVRRGITAKKSLKEIQAAGLGAKWDPWGTGFIPTSRWIETVYRSLTRGTR